MKNVLVVTVLLTALLLTSCSGRSENISKDSPQTLLMETEVPNHYPKEVSSYAVDWFAVNETVAVQALMQSDSPRRIEYAEGPQYLDSLGEMEETLNIYSSAVKGGFNYQLYTNGPDNDWLSELEGCMRTARPWEDDSSSSLAGMEEYPDDVDLDFLDRESALSQAENILKECGITDVEVKNTESRTVELMNHNREQYNSKIEKRNPKLIWSEPFTKAQENYHFEFRKLLNEIPFANCYWSRNIGSTPTNTKISATVSTNGLIQMSVRLFEVGQPISTDEIIPPDEALHVYMDEYNKSIHFTNTKILGVELNYVVVMDSQGMYAKPAWILTTATERKADEYENAEDDFIEYNTIAVSAYSGIILERETDMR